LRKTRALVVHSNLDRLGECGGGKHVEATVKYFSPDKKHVFQPAWSRSGNWFEKEVWA